MKREVNRYTLNLMTGDEYAPFAVSSLENIDRLTTNFNNTLEMINFFKTSMMIEQRIDDFTITYNANKKVKQAELIYSDMRGIISDVTLNQRLNSYLGRYSFVKKLDLDRLDNKFLREKLESLQLGYGLTMAEYNFQLSIFNKHILNEYKLRRDLLIFLNEYCTEKSIDNVVKKTNNFMNQDEIMKCIGRMNVVYEPSKYEVNNDHKYFKYLETGDPYLDYLLEHRDYETIAQSYDLDTLQKLGVQDVLDGNPGIARVKGKAK